MGSEGDDEAVDGCIKHAIGQQMNYMSTHHF
jgi:hypothetical protein